MCVRVGKNVILLSERTLFLILESGNSRYLVKFPTKTISDQKKQLKFRG